MSKTIVGRAYEQQVLTDSLTSHRSELVAIYGRRRIGKTYLIREFFGNKITFGFTGLSTGKRADQIKNFILKLNEVTNEFKKGKQPTDWLEAFSYLRHSLKGLKNQRKKR